MAAQSIVNIHFPYVEPYTPSPNRNPKNNLRDNCWLKALPLENKRETVTTLMYADEYADIFSPFGPVGQSIDLPPVRKTRLFKGFPTAKTKSCSPKPMPHVIHPVVIEQVLQKWESMVPEIVEISTHKENATTSHDPESNIVDCPVRCFARVVDDMNETVSRSSRLAHKKSNLLKKLRAIWHHESSLRH
ncbi:hypothetical protein VTN00DRAFT_9307 [Thermoascus crustaceus]|uniref:uncharacterized protein n=1 Tax=Thermoascus crustaceus TaxID=5088 RepID=UPI0037421BD8